MNCLHCGHANPEGSRFCNACGGKLSLTTSTPTPTARTSYTPPHLLNSILHQRAALEGERKRVTVLFADLKGSTTLAAQLGDEEWHRVLDRYFAILTAGIHRFEGTINQYTGDGIMALFGAPLAQEDHALRACHAALSMQNELRRFTDELRLQQGVSLSMRMGMNSGEVVVGRIGDDLRMDYTAQGHTVNLAARMEQIAEPGRVYLTSNTACQVDGYVQLRDLGALPVKGLDASVHVYELLSLGKMGTRLERSRARGLSHFVGRQRELGLLRTALQQATNEQGQVIAVAGNGGIGKSRLSDELVEQARSQRISVYRATCVPYNAALPLYPVLGLMRAFFDIEETDTLLEQRRKVAGGLMLGDAASQESLPLLFEVLGIGQPDDSAVLISPELKQAHWFELLRRLLLSGQQKAALIVVEDIHWLDAGSESFLASLAEHVHQSHALLLLNYRPEYQADWLTRQVDLELSLGALDSNDLIEMVERRLGTSHEMKSLAQRVVQRAGGNPFFAEEAIQSLLDQAVLEGVVGDYRLTRSLEELPLPDSVQGILAARLDRLDGSVKAVLQVAATIGRDFSESVLKMALARLLPDVELTAALETLVETGYVHPDETDAYYRFCHPLMMEVAYHSQLRDRRRQVHAALAQGLEESLQSVASIDDRSLQLAHHWEQAGNLGKAALWHFRAGVWDAQQGESSGSMPRFVKAAQLASQLPMDRALATLVIQANAGIVRAASMMPAAAELTDGAFSEGERLAQEFDLPVAHAELLLSRATLALQQGDAQSAKTYAINAISLAREHAEEALIGRYRVLFLVVFMSSGYLREGLDLLTPPGQPAWYSTPITPENFLSRGFRGFILAYLGQITEGRRELRTALAIELEARRSVSWLHAMYAESCWLFGDFDEMLREAQAAVGRAERFGNTQFLTFAYRVLGNALIYTGQAKEALQVLARWRRYTHAGESAHQFESAYLTVMAEAYARSGDLAAAQTIVNDALGSATRAQNLLWGCQAQWQFARVQRYKGQFGEATRTLEVASRAAKVVDSDSFAAFILFERAELFAAQGQLAQATECKAEAVTVFRKIGADGWVKRLTHSRGTPATAGVTA